MELFRSGNQTDSSGHSREWTEKDLDTMVKKFEELKTDVPATIGHPESDTAPAFAWFKKFYRKGDTLVGEMSDWTKEFGEMLKNKMFKHRSIALRPDLSLRHVAFLGAAMPAVKGLADFAFKENDEFVTFDFTEAEPSDSPLLGEIKSLFSEMKAWFGSKKAEFKEGAMVPQSIILSKDRFSSEGQVRDWIKENNFKVESNPGIDETDTSYRVRQRDPGQFVEGSFRTKEVSNGISIVMGKLKNPSGDMSELTNMEEQIMTNEELTAKVADLEAKFSEAEKAIQAKKDAKEKAEKEFSDYKAEQKKAEFAAFVDEQVKEGKILPANKEATIKMMFSLDGQESLDFAEGENTVKKTPLDIFRETIINGQKKIEFGEKFTNGQGPAGAGEQLSVEARKISTEKGVSFSEGFRQAQAANPQLAELYAKEVIGQ